jgi:hypothetical protein
METIHRSLEGAPLPDVRVCRHLAGETKARGIPDLTRKKQCANCQGYLCADCEDDAVICHACPAAICEECQEKARKRGICTRCEGAGRYCSQCGDAPCVCRLDDEMPPPMHCVPCRGTGFIPAGRERVDYLCNPCCAKQDAARESLKSFVTTIEFQLRWSELWLDDIVDKLKTAMERAEEAL